MIDAWRGLWLRKGGSPGQLHLVLKGALLCQAKNNVTELPIELFRI